MALRPKSEPADRGTSRAPAIDRWLQTVSILMTVATLLFLGGIGYQIAAGWQIRAELEEARKLRSQIATLRTEAAEHAESIKETAREVQEGKRGLEQSVSASSRSQTRSTSVPDPEGQVEGPDSGREQIEILELILSAKGLRETEDAPEAGVLSSFEEKELHFTLEAGQPVAFSALCSGDCDLTLFGPDDVERARDWLPDQYPVLEYTPEESGDFALRITMFDCSSAGQDATCAWELKQWKQISSRR